MTSSKKSNTLIDVANAQQLLPAEGERRAMRGYMGQYERAGAAIYAELERGQLLWIGIADRSAGIVDDLVLGFDGLVVGHQFKTAKFPGTFTVGTLFTGSDGLLQPLVNAWKCLREAAQGSRVEIRLIVNDYPSTNDKPGDATPAHSAAFLDEFERFNKRSLHEWRTSSWSRLIELLYKASGLNNDDFEQFLHALRVIHGAAADFVHFHKLSTEQARLAAEIANALPRLVADPRDKDRWSREELLRELGWTDPAKTRYLHRFPVGIYVQRNRETELSLLQALRAVDQGYVALVGPPGSGKSTLLEMALATEPNVRIVRYLAFMPGSAQGIGRGEADGFLEDVGAQMRNSGLFGLRLRDNSQHERREQFGALLRQAGERYERDGIRTIIVVDGLDHVPREERPTHSLLAELPLPPAIPVGVVFVLGTQRLDLAHLKPAVQDQAAKGNRLVEMRPLGRDAVMRMANALGLDPAVSRQRLNELSHGHPLATRYLIQALLRADEPTRANLLAGGLAFDGDIESVYASAWREIANDPDAMHVLGFIARAEAPMPLTLLATIVDEQAIERALSTAHHLLRGMPKGWSVFHNSFRLFILSKPRMRLGAVDLTYPQRVYRELAQLARDVPVDSPQCWLELRYRARADDKEEVLTLATPERFRLQLAQGRGVSEIESDIRLALLAVRATHDTTILTRLLLCRDEVARRTIALDNADKLPVAMLAIGDVDAAYAFTKEFPTMGYEVVDALLQQGEPDRAKELFEHLEPLAQLQAPWFQHHGQEHNVREFERWAGRVFHFRDFEQIRQAIDYLAVEGMPNIHNGKAEETAAFVRHRLRLGVAKAIFRQQDSIDLHEICDQLNLGKVELPDLLVQAGFAARDRGDDTQAHTLFSAAAEMPGFDDVPNGWRRSIALFAANSGRQDVAMALFDKLVAPAIAMVDNDIHVRLGDLTCAVLEHTQLCIMLGKPLATTTPSKHVMLRPLQTYANQIGALLGRAVADSHSISAGTVQMVSRSAMGYLLRLEPRDGSDFYLTEQAMTAAPILARSLLHIGSLCGEAEYCAVLHEINEAISMSTLKSAMLLRRELAIAAYQIDGDRMSASANLESLVGELVEDTPSEQLDGLADLAIAFATIGDFERARRLLATVPDHCLGYALAARKDPQYAMWRDVLALANAVDPEQRPQRIAHLMRQVDGLRETEGVNAAHRLTMVLIDEAMQINARSGFDVAQTLAAWDLVSWPSQVDLLLTGALRRCPDLLLACVITWQGLCLPFYIEPYYRDPTHVGDFIDVAANAAGQDLIAKLVSMLLSTIERDSRAHERLTLLMRLRVAAGRHGYTDGHLESAINRWSREAPPPRHSYTASKYDDAASLEELQLAFETESAKLDHNAPYRFVELSNSAPLEQVRQMYEQWEDLRSDTHCRFMMVERLVQAGDTAYARKLIHEYEIRSDQSGSWSSWMGGDKFRYFRARKLLDGAAMHSIAYESLVDSVVGGEEKTQTVLAEIDSILPVICSAPDWPAIWSLLAEQMASTREHQIGTPFEVSQEPMSDEGMLAELLHFTLCLPIATVRQHAQHCALQLAHLTRYGELVFELTMRRLLAGASDEPLQALLTLLLLDHNCLAPTLGRAVANLVNHRDLGVAEAAELLAGRWAIQVSKNKQTLPLFYQIELVGSADESRTLLDNATGAIRLEDAMGWTQMYRPVAQALAKAAGSDELHIRQRAAMFIQEWGGIEEFGQNALKRLERKLYTLSMKMTYYKPHAWVGVLALRNVAGELRQAGLLSRREIPTLLERLNVPLPPRPPMPALVRPLGIRRPLLIKDAPWQEAEKLWAERVHDNIVQWSDCGDDYVVAEISKFKISQVRRAEYHLHCIRAPGLEAGGKNFWDWYRQLPTAVWLGQIVPLDGELAPTLVRRFVSTFGMDMPEYPITLCPNWLQQLGWKAQNNELSIYVDTTSVVVAKLGVWRDAGPADIENDLIWGEGSYVTLTEAGLQQFKARRKEIIIRAFSIREVQMLQKDGENVVKMAQRDDSL
ncbi:ATP-binding protein [Pseudoduganella lutea]|uniref:ATP-binding protein n=1 Tax=Pseudoduganella lutea TaxID=321985 RepID=A0A4P6L0V2_9BURK|nr:ATP-binding protein [Pseudoduganella lutea]QBE64917.1 ATP-binding protein [Pseudoduganella lutea]